ncbi:FAD-binding domain-containing protein [Phellopilus nigrolimitatus]|nr:FAD-binding domain-containing protein [Phellopilus nigrolimitatus]
MAATTRATMGAKVILLSSVLLSAAAGAAGMSHMWERTLGYTDVCKQIADNVSSLSDVYYPLSVQYSSDIAHWASSSSQSSACSVEPGSAADVGAILRILGSAQTPFAVKGGGHTSNPGFSSTEGVQIAMTRFNEVVYNADAGTVDIGPGLIWDDVYSALEGYNVSVVGGRVTGVGVAGFTLGGGYSWKTNQFGLTIDTVQSFELVLPNGTVTTVTSSSNPDLFFGLRGGFNNFGIVTKFTLKTYPQTDVWGGLIVFTGDKIDALATATSNFNANLTDPKAAVIAELNVLEGLAGATLNVFYDAPTPPDGIFDEFLAIEPLSKDISTRSLISLVQSAPSNATAGMRGAFHTVTVEKFSQDLMNVIVNETIFWGANLASLFSTGTFISYDIEPFLPSIFSHGSDSAYPASRARGLLPLNIYYAWVLETGDAYFHDAIVQSAATITAAADAQGQDIADAALYGNYAVNGTAVSRIYEGNLDRLQTIRAQYDPDRVMALAGGWKF